MPRTRHPTPHLLSLAAAALLSLPAPTPADVLSTFDTSADGWTIAGDAATPTYLATGGNPGGHIRATDFVGGQSWFFAAPAKFLGNQSPAYGGTLSFDLSQQISGSPAPYNDSDVLLIGGGVTLVFNTPANPATYPTWSSYSIPINTSAGWHLNSVGGAAPTETQMRTALASLTSLRIRGEYQSGADTGYLDNVRLLTDALPGDANLNGVIDRDDFALTDRGLARNLTGWSNGDFNADNLVNAADLLILHTAFANQSPAPTLPLPEPTAPILLLLTTPALLLHRRTLS